MINNSVADLRNKFGIEFRFNPKRYALHIAIEFWDDGIAWAFEIGPFGVTRIPVEKK